MLEQPNGLARRCVAAAGGDPSLLLERVDAYIKRQPRVSGDSGQVLGRNLEALVTRAEEVKARMGDDFVSVDHLLLACCDDQRCGAQLLAEAVALLGRNSPVGVLWRRCSSARSRTAGWS